MNNNLKDKIQKGVFWQGLERLSSFGIVFFVLITWHTVLPRRNSVLCLL